MSAFITEHKTLLMILLPIFLVGYFLPTIISFVLKGEQKSKIFFANLISGISWFAWFSVLFWAIRGSKSVSNNNDEKTIAE
ncbi:superinfection immunity protein [Sessilibacter sp. MAH2]